MICKSTTFSGVDTPNKNWPNWSGRVTFHADHYLEPFGGAAGLQNLVFAVATATGQGKGLHPIGSGWAFSDIAATDSETIAIDNFTARLDYAVTTGAALTDAWRLKQADPTSATHLVHIEAGMEIGALTDLLAMMTNPANGTALPMGLATMGGSNGQSVAGAFSTSTHGGDWDIPPLVDCVRAIHLVTDGGQEIWLERASDPITTDARLQPVLTCPYAQILRSDDVFNAALVGFGRFGVIYSLVLEVRSAFRVVQVATQPSRTQVYQALTQGMGNPNLFDPLFALLAKDPVPSSLAEASVISQAANRPYFWELAFNSLNPDDLLVRRRWITSNLTDLNSGGGGTSEFLVQLGQGGLNAAWASPFPAQEGAAIVHLVMNMIYGSAISQGARGPHPVMTSNTRAASHNWPYKADSVEVVFSAEDPAYIDYLNTIQAACGNYLQAGYISVRPSRSSRATMSMHNVAGSHAISIEIASLKGQPSNDAWMQFVHDAAVERGGRPHWGQINTLTDAQMQVLYGQQRRNWQIALNRLSGGSTIFSNAFTRQRGLEPATPAHKIAAAAPVADHLVAMRVAASGAEAVPIQATRWAPGGPWSGWQPLAPNVASPDSWFGAASVDGYGHFFVIGADGWVYHISLNPAGHWSGWGVAGRSSEPAWNGVPCGAANAVSCQSGMLHVFYADRNGRIVGSRADTTGGVVTWPENLKLLGGRTAPGGHVTAVSRGSGQVDVFAVGVDGQVMTCSWNAAQGWKGWWTIPGVLASPGAHVAAVSRSLDQLDIFVVDVGGRIMSAAWNPTQTGWAGWWQIQAGTTKGGFVTAVSRSADLLDIFTTDAGQQVQTAAWDPAHGWGGWWPVAACKAQSVVWPVSRSTDKLDLFFADPSGAAQTAAWAPGQGWGGPWALN